MQPVRADHQINVAGLSALQPDVDPLAVVRAKGVWFWTADGRRFLDFNSQLMCVNIGHGDERVVEAMKRQLDTLPYANPFTTTEVRARLGEKLASLAPGDIDTFFFTNAGADANENAMKIARWVTVADCTRYLDGLSPR